jgi:hypothetical protein
VGWRRGGRVAGEEETYSVNKTVRAASRQQQLVRWDRGDQDILSLEGLVGERVFV